MYRGVETIQTSGYTDAERTLDFSGELTTKDFHVRWNREDGFYYIDELDATYNPTAAGWFEGDYCDTTFEDMFIGRVAWDGTDWVLMFTPENKRRFEFIDQISSDISTHIHSTTWLVLPNSISVINWSRMPKFNMGIYQLGATPTAGTTGSTAALEQLILEPDDIWRTKFSVKYRFEDENSNAGWVKYSLTLTA